MLVYQLGGRERRSERGGILVQREKFEAIEQICLLEA